MRQNQTTQIIKLHKTICNYEVVRSFFQRVANGNNGMTWNEFMKQTNYQTTVQICKVTNITERDRTNDLTEHYCCCQTLIYLLILSHIKQCLANYV